MLVRELLEIAVDKIAINIIVQGLVAGLALEARILLCMIIIIYHLHKQPPC